jgi:hypothetical protein
MFAGLHDDDFCERPNEVRLFYVGSESVLVTGFCARAVFEWTAARVATMAQLLAPSEDRNNVVLKPHILAAIRGTAEDHVVHSLDAADRVSHTSHDNPKATKPTQT